MVCTLGVSMRREGMQHTATRGLTLLAASCFLEEASRRCRRQAPLCCRNAQPGCVRVGTAGWLHSAAAAAAARAAGHAAAVRGLCIQGCGTGIITHACRGHACDARTL